VIPLSSTAQRLRRAHRGPGGVGLSEAELQRSGITRRYAITLDRDSSAIHRVRYTGDRYSCTCESDGMEDAAGSLGTNIRYFGRNFDVDGCF
jgi:hypothetical protein